MPKLFRPFFTTKRMGTGLGLAVVQKIIVQHGGQVQARESPGRRGCIYCYVTAATKDTGSSRIKEGQHLRDSRGLPAAQEGRIVCA